MDTDNEVTLNFKVTEATRREFKSAAAAAGKTIGEFLAQILEERRAAGLDLTNGTATSPQTQPEAKP
jgi:uncharacterized protein (DUF1778 family)